MDQSTFWVVSSVNFLCVIVVTITNIIVSRKTSLKINRLTHINGIEQKQHDKLILQLAEFLSVIDENRITLPVTKLDFMLENEVQKDATFSELRCNKSNAEIAYYKLLLLSQYSKTDFSIVENSINAIMSQYRLMYDNLMSGLVDHVHYYEMAPEQREYFSNMLRSSTNHLADYSEIRSSFVEQKDELIKTLRKFVYDEIQASRKTLK